MISSLVNVLARFHREEDGQGIVEYMLLIVFVALAATAGMSAFATAINSLFSEIGVKVGQYI